MKKRNKIILTIIIFVSISYFAYAKFFSNNWGTQDTFTMEPTIITVEEKDFNSGIQITGKTKIKNEQSIKFNKTWRVEEVNFNAGETVLKWQTIAKIDDSKARSEIQKVTLDLENAQLKLNQFEENLKNVSLKRINLDIKSLESQIQQAKTKKDYQDKNKDEEIQQKYLSLLEQKNNYQILEQEVKKNISSYNLTDQQRENIIASKKLEIKSLEEKYKKLDENFDEQLQKNINAYISQLENSYYSLESDIISIDNILTQVNKIYGLNDEDKMNNFDLFSAKNTQYKNEARSYAYSVNQLYLDYKQAFEKIENTTDAQNIIWAQQVNKKLQIQLAKLANSLASAFENSVESINFSSWEISWYSSTYLGIYSSATSKITSLKSTIDELQTSDSIEKITQDLENQKQSLQNSIAQSKIDIQQVNDNQDFLTQTAQFNIENEKIKLQKALSQIQQAEIAFEEFSKNQQEELLQANISLERLEIQYNEKIKEKNELLEKQKNQEYLFLVNDVKQKKVELEDTYNTLEDYYIQAPFDGIITKNDIKPGDRLTPDSQNSISIVDPNTIEINTQVSQSDIVKISIWDSAKIVLDAYEDTTFTGAITQIETTPTQENGISKFSTKISLNNPEKLKLFSGMQANITIELEKIPTGVVVPFISVNTDLDGEKYVNKIWEDWEKIKTYIQVWYTDGKYYQVLEWIEAWEQIEQIDLDMSQFSNNYDF